MDKAKIASKLAEIARTATQEVGPYLREAFRQTMDVSIKHNNFHDPVTVHDREVESRLRTYLAQAVPGSYFLGEENSAAYLPTQVNDCCREEVSQLGKLVHWIVDPIDGTANFFAGRNYFGTSIGVELAGEMVAGAIHLPFTAETFWADNQGAYYEHDGNTISLHADGPHREDQALLLGYYPTSAPDSERSRMLARAHSRLGHAYATLRSPGAAALDLAHIAAGWAGVATGNAMEPWDVAAGFHLVRMAGGKVQVFPTSEHKNTDVAPHLCGRYVAWGANLSPNTALEVWEQCD